MYKLKDKTSVVLQYMLLVFMCLIIVLPIMILLVASFKTNIEFAKTGVFTLPETFNIDNYERVVEPCHFLVALKNTTIILFFSIVLNVAIGTMLAYVLGRFEFRMKKLIMFMVMAVKVIPTVTTQVATFKVVQGLGVYDTLIAPIILYASTDVIQVFLYLRFVNSIPRALDESALIDGASYFRIYWSIILPLMKPAIVTSVILKAVHIYNDMYIPYLYIPSSSNAVVSTAIMKFCGSNQGAQIPLMASAFIVVMIPMLIFYLCSQKFIYSGLTNGAVKE